MGVEGGEDGGMIWALGMAHFEKSMRDRNEAVGVG